MKRVIFTITASKDVVGSYFEVLLGSLAMSGVLKAYSASKFTEGDEVSIVVDCTRKEPPLRDIGIDDIPERKL